MSGSVSMSESMPMFKIDADPGCCFVGAPQSRPQAMSSWSRRSSPPSRSSPACPRNEAGDKLVCICGCTSIVAVACATACPSAAPLDPIVELPAPAVSSIELVFSPLSNDELACDVNAGVGPFVAPTLDFPAVVNGSPAETVCAAPGEQLVGR